MVRASSAALLIAATLLQATAVVLCGIPATMTLERAFPTNHGVPMSQLRARDKIRHGRMLQSSKGVINLLLRINVSPKVQMLYYTTVKLGSPPREFHVQIDTGSDVLWVSCNSCKGCPESTGLDIRLNSFDPKESSTSSNISCSDKRCSVELQSSDQSTCSYGDGSTTSGFYVSDLFYFDVISGNGSVSTNSSAPIVFGPFVWNFGYVQQQDDTANAVDGIFGFGQQNVSVISQLSSQGVAPKAFSHCLIGDDTGGGTFVLGKIDDPSIVYTPLVPYQPRYNVNLQNITVNGKIVPNISEFFTTSSDQGTIVDSGTTLAYIAGVYYYPFIDTIKSFIPNYTTPDDTLLDGFECYEGITSINDVFPQVGFHFAGGASMVLEPKDYLIQQKTTNRGQAWCIGFQFSNVEEITILRDLVLKDKIIVYDLDAQRIGWTNYNCSRAVDVTANTRNGTETVTVQPTIASSSSRDPSPNSGSSSRNEPSKLKPIYLCLFVMLISFLLI
ncbi:hypothetical protein UlMin_007487 [Ulmus minor]